MLNQNFLNKKEITRKTKLPIFWCESLPLSSRQTGHLQATEMSSSKCGIRNNSPLLELAQLRWYGHIVRVGDVTFPEWPQTRS